MGGAGNPRNRAYAAAKNAHSLTFGLNHVPTNTHKFLHQGGSRAVSKVYLNGPTLMDTKKGWM
jgi:hypothetical protein